MMMIAATIPTSEAVFMVLCFVVTMIYGAIVEIRRDNTIKELDESFVVCREGLDAYMKSLDDAEIRTSKNTESKSKGRRNATSKDY